MNRPWLALATVAFLATTVHALPRDPRAPQPPPPTRPEPAPQAGERRVDTYVDAYAQRNRGHGRDGFAAFDAGLTLGTDDRTATQGAAGLGFTLGAYLTRGLVIGGRASLTLDTADARERPPLRDVGVSFGLDVRVWRPLWVGAGLGYQYHRFEDPGMTRATPTVRLRAGVDVYRMGETTLFANADWVADLAADSSTRLTTLALGLRYR